MTNNDFILLDEVQNTIRNCTKNPENFLSVQEDLFEDFKKCTKSLYDLALKSNFLRHSKSEVLPELIIKDFDTEQIWQQIELVNNEVFNDINLKEISKILVKKESWDLPIKIKEDTNSDEFEYSNNESKEQELIPEESDDDSIIKEDRVKRKETSNSIKKRKRTSEVDDKFFKLDELDEYLKKEDKREMNMNIDNTSSDEESIDLFNDYSDLDNEELEDDETENRNSLKYNDFFDRPESDEDQENRSEDNSNDSQNEDEADENQSENEGSDSKNENNTNYNKNENNTNDNKNENNTNDNKNENNTDEIQQKKYTNDKKQVKFNLLNDSDQADTEENDVVKNQENKIETSKSSLETRQERLKKRIAELEKEAISEKPWQLMGETSGSNRPQNSLLEEYVEFDTAARPAPVMTEQTTMKLEDIIRGRIKDKTWDDVEKKFKPVETPMEYKKKLILNQEKSKESLAQIYENEYMKQRETLNLDDKDEQEKEEPPEHIEIRQKMHDLFTKLDALSNFHYTPKLARPEIKIISNIPAINMEEVAPVATSSATLLAPEEIHSKHKGELIGKSERTKTDMKRARRKKKLRQHARAVNESKKLVENSKQKKSLKNAAVLEKLKGRNIINTNDDTSKTEKSIKSSTAFFAHLQDQVTNTIKQNTSKNTKKKKNKLSIEK